MMKKTLLFSLMGLTLCSIDMSAYTNAEIAARGKIWLGFPNEYYIDNAKFGNVPFYQEGDIDIKLSTEGYLEVPFMEGIFYWDELAARGVQTIKIDVQGTKAYIMNPMENINLRGGQSGTRILVNQYDFTELTSIGNYRYGLFALDKNFNYCNGRVTGEVTKDENGDFTIQFNPFHVFKVSKLGPSSLEIFDINDKSTGRIVTDYYYRAYNDDYYAAGGGIYKTYTSNATIEDTEYLYDNNKTKTDPYKRSYSANVKISGNSIEIENFGNIGLPYVPYLSSNRYYPRYEKFDGSIDLENKQVKINARTVMSDYIEELSGRNYVNNLYELKMCSDFNLSQNRFDPISGDVSFVVNHTGNSKWLDGVNNKTAYQDMILNLNDYFYSYVRNTTYYNSAFYENTKVKLTVDIDYTHDFNIKVNDFGYGTVAPNDPDTYLYINCEFEGFKNSAFVEGYELYIMPKDANPNFDAADYQDANGHTKGTRIDLDENFTYFPNYPEQVRRNAPGMGGYEIPENPYEGNKYNMLIAENDIEADKDGQYMLYAKAIYTPESGLEPTFHALTPLGNPNTTGVESIIDNGVADEDAPVVYYNMNGVEVSGDALTPGLYIRKQGNNATKVVIR